MATVEISAALHRIIAEQNKNESTPALRQGSLPGASSLLSG